MHDEHCQSGGKCISWGAIFGGAFVALGLTFLFNLLTVALGMSLFTQDSAGKLILGIAGFAWILIGIYIILFIAGWVAGTSLGHKSSLRDSNGWVHGFLAWTIYLIITLFVLSYIANESTAVLIRTTVVEPEQAAQAPAAATDEEDGTVSKHHTEHAAIAIDKAHHADITNIVHRGGAATFVTFFIFLIGAVGSCVGGTFGIKRCRKWHEECGAGKTLLSQY